MSNELKALLSRFDLSSSHECTLAVRETIQEIALVGLWRAKFFEKAAFYGGTALRILYGLDRYSEDLDFSLLTPSPDFQLDPYYQAVANELESYGFTVTVETKRKSFDSKIESAFIKTNTHNELLRIGLPDFLHKGLHARSTLKIKLEVDTDPPQGFQTEMKTLLQPTPVSIRVYRPSDLFAGKMHAVLCRLWQSRIKGRDWYDFVWYVRRKTPLNLAHLQERMWQSGCLPKDIELTQDVFIGRLKEKIINLDVENALQDIRPFIKDAATIASWSTDYFLQFTDLIDYM